MIDGRAWLTDNIEQAQGVTEAAWKTVADFSLLWSLFEAKLCGRRANPARIVTVADGFGSRNLEAPMQAAFAYWQDRYVEYGQANTRFDELFHDPGGRVVAEPVILNPAPSEAEKLKCILLIVYRLRNNLFHGNKEIRTFNDQKENLDHGTTVLTEVMEWYGVH